jgi:hypothetical protein
MALASLTGTWQTMSRNTRFFKLVETRGLKKQVLKTDRWRLRHRKAVTIRRTIQSIPEHRQDEKREFAWKLNLMINILSSYPLRFFKRRIFTGNGIADELKRF